MADGQRFDDDLPGPQEIIDLIRRNKKYILIGVGLIFAAILMFSSYFQVEPEEKAVVLRFGDPIDDLFGPGLHFKIPFVDEVYKVAVEQQHRIEFGDVTDPGIETRTKMPPRGTRARQELEQQALMLTGDLQLVKVRWSIIFKISDPKIWLFEVRDPEQTIRDVSEAVMRQKVGDYSLHEVLTVKVRTLQDEAKRETQRALQFDVPTGVVLTELAIKDTDVPSKPIPDAKQAFDRFNATEPQVRERLSKAKAAQQQVTGTAELEKKRAVGSAQRLYEEVVENARGEADAFRKQLSEYDVAPEITRQWMYLQTMGSVLVGLSNKVVIDGEGGAGATLNLLPLTDLIGTGKAGGK